MELGFLNSVYYVKTESLLSDDDFNALKRLEKSLFFRYLKTKDYGYGSKYEELDEIIAQELINTQNEINKILDDTLLTDSFYILHNITNIKIVYKSIKYDTEITNFDNVSSFNKEAIFQALKYQNYKLLPENVIPLFEAINKIDSSNIQFALQEIELLTYRFYEDLINQSKYKKQYRALIDYIELEKTISNLTTFLRLRKRNEKISKLEKSLFENKFITKDVWLEIYNKNDRDVINKLHIYFNEELTNAIRVFLDNNDTNKLDQAITKYQTEQIKILSYDDNTVGPIVYYLYLKQLETLKVRKLYYAK